MARRRKAADPQQAAVEELVAGVETPEQLEAVFRQLKQRMVEQVLQAELTAHLGYPPGEGRGADGNARNGTTPKTVLTEEGALPLAIPRDRAGTFTPAFVPKGVRRLPGFDQKVLSLCARGLTVRDLQAHLAECYQVPVSPDVITAVTDAVWDEAQHWQQRPLEPVYVAVALDGLRVKMRTEGIVRQQVVYFALGFLPDGTKEVLGFWIAAEESAAFWQRVLTELQGRGVQDILIALIDGLAGFPAAIEAVFPDTVVQQCVVHLVRQSLRTVNWRQRKAIAAELKAIYLAPGEAAARTALATFAASPLGQAYPEIPVLWERHWARIAPALLYPVPVRRLLYSTNAIESLHATLRKSLKVRGHFPNADAAAKLLYLALRHATPRLHTPQHWREAMRHIRLPFGDRVPADA
ncbi:MAG: IS256 family transposase [Gemmatimonadales bacterium]